MLLHACCGTQSEPGDDLFLPVTPPVDDVIVRHELNICKQLYWWWTRSCTAYCSVACFSGNKNAHAPIHFETSTAFIMDTGSTDHTCKESNFFVGKIMPCPKINIKGIGGQLNAKGSGTVKFKIVDGHGKTHEMLVHNVLHVPDSPVNLFSPQKFARDDESNGISGTCFLTCGNTSHFIWHNSKYIKTFNHPFQESLPILHVNEGFNAINMFNQFGNPMVCTVIEDRPIQPVSFNDSGDAIIPIHPNDSMAESNGPAVIDHVPDDLSE